MSTWFKHQASKATRYGSKMVHGRIHGHGMYDPGFWINRRGPYNISALAKHELRNFGGGKPKINYNAVFAARKKKLARNRAIEDARRQIGVAIRNARQDLLREQYIQRVRMESAAAAAAGAAKIMNKRGIDDDDYGPGDFRNAAGAGLRRPGNPWGV